MTKRQERNFRMISGNPIPLGVSLAAQGVQFAIALPGATKCILHLYKKDEEKPLHSFLLSEEKNQRVGDVFFGILQGENVEQDRKSVV